MCETAWNNLCRLANTNNNYVFHKPFHSTFDICDRGFCYCLLLANDLLRRNVHHDTEWQQLLPPPLPPPAPFLATSFFLFLGQTLEMLATVLFAFIRLSANSHEKYPTINFRNIYKVPKNFDIPPLAF